MDKISFFDSNPEMEAEIEFESDFYQTKPISKQEKEFNKIKVEILIEVSAWSRLFIDSCGKISCLDYLNCVSVVQTRYVHNNSGHLFLS